MTTAQCMVSSQSVSQSASSIDWKRVYHFISILMSKKVNILLLTVAVVATTEKAVINLLAAQTAAAAAAVGFPKWSLIRWNQWWPDDAPIDIFLFNVWMSGCVSTKVSKSVYCVVSLSLSLILHTFLLCTLQFTSKLEKKQQVRLDSCSDSKIVLVLMMSENG